MSRGPMKQMRGGRKPATAMDRMRSSRKCLLALASVFAAAPVDLATNLLLLNQQRDDGLSSDVWCETESRGTNDLLAANPS